MSAYGVPNPTASGVNQPDYIDLSNPNLIKERANTTQQTGSSMNVIFIKEGEVIPLHQLAGHIGFYQASAGRPTLNPILKIPYADVKELLGTAEIIRLYQNLLDRLSPGLKLLLELDKQKPLEERDPDLYALDLSLQFDAAMLAYIAGVSQPLSEKIQSEINTLEFQNHSDEIMDHTTEYTKEITEIYKNYLEEIGRNDPDYEVLSNVLYNINEAASLLSTLRNQAD